MLNKLASFLAERRLNDLNSGLRVFRKSELIPFLPLLPQNFSFTTTITLCMTCNGKIRRSSPWQMASFSVLGLVSSCLRARALLAALPASVCLSACSELYPIAEESSFSTRCRAIWDGWPASLAPDCRLA